MASFQRVKIYFSECAGALINLKLYSTLPISNNKAIFVLMGIFMIQYLKRLLALKVNVIVMGK